MIRVVFAGCVLAAACVRAGDDVDPTTLYDVSAQVTPQPLRATATGAIDLRITPKDGAHVSPDSPLKVRLKATDVTVKKAELGRADVLPGPGAQTQFVVPVTAGARSGSVEADVVFFICTEQLCARQSRKLAIPVAVK